MSASGTDEGVDFIYEQDDFAVSGGHLLNDPFEAFLEFPFVLGSGDEGGDVEHKDALGL